MPFRITVTEIKFPADQAANVAPSVTEIYAQTVDDLDIRKFAVQVNKAPRASRKAKAAKV